MSWNLRGKSRRRLDGETVVVTGAASGIGEALAREAAARGAKVALLDIAAEPLARVAEGLPDATSYEVDIRDVASVADVASRIESELGVPRLVFINAGVCAIGETLDLPLEDAKWLLDVNVFGTLVVAKHFAPAMIRQGEGALVFTASIAGILPVPGLSVYCASKHAVMGLADSMRLELRRSGVSVTTICPGYVPTGLHAATRYSHPGLERLMGKAKGGVSPESVARQAVDAALARRPVVLVGAEKAGVWLRRFSPRTYDQIGGRLTRVLDLL